MSINSIKNCFYDLFDGDDIIFLCDNKDLINWLKNKNLTAVYFDDYSNSSKNIVSIQSSTEHFNKIKSLSEQNDFKALSLPQIAFDNNYNTLIYSCEKLFATKFDEAFKKSRLLLEKLAYLPNKVLIKNKAANLSCQFAEKVVFTYPNEILIQPKKIRSAAQYLEIDFEHTDKLEKEEFFISGEMQVNAILIAKTPTESTSIYHKNEDLIRLVINKVANSKESYICFKNNKLLKFTIDGENHLNEILKLAGTYRHNDITEFAFGLNESIHQSPKWHLNSQMNEGAFGIHIGIGEGRTGYHIDFISNEFDVIQSLEADEAYV